MVMAHGDDPQQSRMGWQGDAVDVEITSFQVAHGMRYRWSLYHQARLIRTGVRRTPRGADLAGRFARWWFRFTAL